LSFTSDLTTEMRQHRMLIHTKHKERLQNFSMPEKYIAFY